MASGDGLVNVLRIFFLLIYLIMQPSAEEEMMQRGGGETHKKHQPVPQNIKKEKKSNM